jgi:hypothetical protein
MVPKRRASIKAAAPTARFKTTATSELRLMPKLAISQKPAARVPATAPSVLSAYSRPMYPPAKRGSLTRYRLSTGNVPPISDVGTRRTRNEIVKRRIFSRTREPSGSLPSNTYKLSTPAMATGTNRATTPMPISSQP